MEVTSAEWGGSRRCELSHGYLTEEESGERLYRGIKPAAGGQAFCCLTQTLLSTRISLVDCCLGNLWGIYTKKSRCKVVVLTSKVIIPFINLYGSGFQRYSVYIYIRVFPDVEDWFRRMSKPLELQVLIIRNPTILPYILSQSESSIHEHVSYIDLTLPTEIEWIAILCKLNWHTFKLSGLQGKLFRLGYWLLRSQANYKCFLASLHGVAMLLKLTLNPGQQLINLLPYSGFNAEPVVEDCDGRRSGIFPSAKPRMKDLWPSTAASAAYCRKLQLLSIESPWQ